MLFHASTASGPSGEAPLFMGQTAVYALRASDGAVRYIHSRGTTRRDAQGRLLQIIGTERDITDEREAVQQTEALNERLRLALRSSNFGVWELDLASGIRHWDDRMLDSLREYALAGQPVICTPFLLMGAMSPVTIPASLAQQIAEALTGIPWYWLAAIHLQETRMGRIQGVSSAGAASVPADIAGLAGYDVVVLSDVRATDISATDHFIFFNNRCVDWECALYSDTVRNFTNGK